MKTVFSALCIALLATTVAAHSPLMSTAPANGAVIEGAPAELMMSFQSGFRLTRVTATHEAGSVFDVDLSAVTGFSKQVSLPFKGRAKGTYVIDWRGLSADGHGLDGSFSFVVN